MVFSADPDDAKKKAVEKKEGKVEDENPTLKTVRDAPEQEYQFPWIPAILFPYYISWMRRRVL